MNRLAHGSVINLERQENHTMSATSDKIKGRVKEAVGDLTDDPKLKREGKLDRAAGKVKETAEKVVDRARNAAKR